LRLHLRSTFMPGYELRSEVTAIGPAQAAPSLFVVPSDYQKIASPVGGGTSGAEPAVNAGGTERAWRRAGASAIQG